MAECHIGWTVMAKTNETTVCTETAIGITMIAMIEMSTLEDPVLLRRAASTPAPAPGRSGGANPAVRSRRIAMSGMSGRNR